MIHITNTKQDKKLSSVHPHSIHHKIGHILVFILHLWAQVASHYVINEQGLYKALDSSLLWVIPYHIQYHIYVSNDWHPVKSLEQDRRAMTDVYYNHRMWTKFRVHHDWLDGVIEQDVRKIPEPRQSSSIWEFWEQNHALGLLKNIRLWVKTKPKNGNIKASFSSWVYLENRTKCFNFPSRFCRSRGKREAPASFAVKFSKLRQKFSTSGLKRNSGVMKSKLSRCNEVD